MHKIMIDGGSRKAMNTAQRLHRFADGAVPASERVEVNIVRLPVRLDISTSWANYMNKNN